MNQRGEFSIKNILILGAMLLLSGIYFTTVYPEIIKADSGDHIFFQLMGLGIALVGIYAVLKKPSYGDAQISGF